MKDSTYYVYGSSLTPEIRSLIYKTCPKCSGILRPVFNYLKCDHCRIIIDAMAKYLAISENNNNKTG